MSAVTVAPSPDQTDRRPRPPIAELAVGTLALIVVGGIYLATTMTSNPTLVPAIVLLALAGVLLAANVVQIVRLTDFSWRTFWQVGGWAQLAYVVVAGMLLYVFILDGVRGGRLVVLTLMLVVFAVNIPLLLAFSVARHQPAER